MCRVPHTKPAYGSTLAEGSETLARWLHESARVLVGAGAGLSVAAGIDYTDEEDFARHFPALIRRRLRARYQLIGYDGLEEPAFWGYWASHVQQIRFTPRQSIVYRAALRPAPREGRLCADVQRGRHVRATWLRRLARLFHPRRLCAHAVPDPLSPGRVAERSRRPAPGGGYRSGDTGGHRPPCHSAMSPLRRRGVLERARWTLVRGCATPACGPRPEQLGAPRR